MNVSSRQFLFHDDGTTVGIPNAKFDRMFRGDEPLKEYARSRVRWLTVVVELRERKPFRVRAYHASYLWFDAHGFILQRKQSEYERLKLKAAFSPREAQDAERQAEVRAALERLKAEWEWEPTSQERSAIGKVIWPKR